MTDTSPGSEAATNRTPCGAVPTGCVSDYVLTPLDEFRALSVASLAAGALLALSAQRLVHPSTLSDGRSLLACVALTRRLLRDTRLLCHTRPLGEFSLKKCIFTFLYKGCMPTHRPALATPAWTVDVDQLFMRYWNESVYSSFAGDAKMFDRANWVNERER